MTDTPYKTSAARVFIVQENPKIDMTPALHFGSLVPLLGPGEETMSFSATYAVNALGIKLRDFDDDDFILPVGDPVAIGIACALAARNNAGRYHVLKWDRHARVYFPVLVNLYA